MRINFSKRVKKIDVGFERIMLPSLLIILIVSTLVQCREVCTTQNCLQIANMLKTSMKPDVDPCEDFATHVCGNWVYNETTDTSYVVQKIQQDALMQPIDETDIDATRKIKTFFQACQNYDERNRRGEEPLLNMVNANGGWPLISPGWTPNDRTLQQIHEKYATDAIVSPLFEIRYNFSAADLVKNDAYPEYRIFIPEVHWEQKKDWDNITATPVLYEEPNWLNNYYKFIYNIANHFAVSSGYILPDIDEDIQDMINFERQLDAYWRASYSELAYTTTIKGVQQSWDDSIGDRKDLSINWLDVIAKRIPIRHYTTEDDDVDVGTSLDLLSNLAEILKQYSLKTIVNYIHWQVISEYLKFLDFGAWQYDEEEKLNLFGDSAKFGKDAELSCIPRGMKHAATYMAMDKVHIPSSTQIIQHMFDHIQDEIDHEIKQSKWLVAPAKNKLSHYIEATKERIGFPKFYNQPAKLNQMYKSLDISDNYFENVLNVRKFAYAQVFKRMVKKSKAALRTFKMKSTTVNAAFYYNENSITIPEAQFLMPIFGPDLPSYYIYGRLGAIVGHELTHAFNRLQFIFDVGNKQPWVTMTVNKMRKKEQCFIEQFDPFGEFYGILNGTENYRPGALTLDENLADHGGLKASYNVLKKLKREGRLENDKKLPNFEGYTDEQMFFYSNGLDYCAGIHTPLTEHMAKDAHMPNRFRLIGSLQNMKEFADAFKCKPKTKMNPEKKCVLWE